MGSNLYIPPEILISIFTYLATVDIKSARLVCNRFGALGAPFLMKTAYFAVTVNAIERFLNIANHPIFSRSIRTVIYQGAFFRKDMTDRDAFFDQIGPTQDALDNGWVTHEAVMRSFQRYCNLNENQQRLTDSGEAVASLADGLRRMTRVDTIIFTDFWDEDDRYGYYESDRCDGIKPQLFPTLWRDATHLPDFG
ncbi:MAG: hypothetical protein M1840_004741 [Geoglossum simile]|nr:MAG: hypothetical protein M1840_004741 [Geoglossum simile]